MTGDGLRATLSGAFERWAACAEEARELDAALGDGDLGITVAAAARAGQEAMAGMSDGATPGQVLLALGPAVARSNPSTFAALAAAGLLAASKALHGVDDASPADLLRAARAAADTVAARGKSAVGDKTVLDALVPSLDAAEAAGSSGAGGAAALGAATAAARAGVAETAGLVSQRGRAAWIGERGRGHADAGATVYLRFLEALSAPGAAAD